MLKAQIQQKVPVSLGDWSRSEDLLTSSIFGSLSYYHDDVIASAIGAARMLAGSRPPNLIPPLRLEFWPQHEYAEPDVVLTDSQGNICIIEAKLDAPFGERQLEREWIGGTLRTHDANELWLVTVTAHAGMPFDELMTQASFPGCDRERIGWLSWTTIAQCVDSCPVPSQLLDDIVQLLDMLGLAPYRGVHQLALEVRGIPWASRLNWLLSRDLAGGVDVFAELRLTASMFGRLKWLKEGWDG